MSWLQRALTRHRLRRARAQLAPEHPALARYLEDFEPLAASTELAELRFVVVDTEATGLDPSEDRMLSLAAVAVDGEVLRAGDSLELTVAHDEVGREAATIHGMVRADLADGVAEVEALAAFVELLGSSVFVAHHAEFDRALIAAALTRHGAAALFNPVLDTAALARRIELGPVALDPAASGSSLRFDLDSVAERFLLETDARHTAAGDALLTAELLLRLLAHARRAGVATLGNLL